MGVKGKSLKGEIYLFICTILWVKLTNVPKDFHYAMARTVGIKGGVNNGIDEVQTCSCGD